MPNTTTVTFTDGPDGPTPTYADPTGYAFTSQSNLFQHQDGSLFSVFSGDEVAARNATGKAFGVVSIDLDGLKGLIQNGTAYSTSAGVVTFSFYGVHADGTLTDTVTFQTNGVSDFQTFRFDAATIGSTFAAEFASGLTELHWSVSDGGFNAWGAFDNLVVVQNTAPVATGIVGSSTTLPDGTISGHLGATDADGQALTYHIAGTAPAGVVVDQDGTFYVLRQPADDDLLPGQTRTVSFSYQANDGSEDSTATTVSVTFAGAPLGRDINGGNRGDNLNGTSSAEHIYAGNGNDKVNGGAGGDTICGGNGNDTLNGDAGNDALYAQNGSDVLNGGDGKDWLWGDNGRDTLNGGAGNDTLIGDNSNDRFVFGQDFGKDVIVDFRSGHWDDEDCSDNHYRAHHDHRGQHWEAGDVIQITPSEFGSFSDLMAHAKQQWYGVVITTDDGDSITLMGVSLRSLHVDDFVFA
jgi:hypothetical protein